MKILIISYWFLPSSIPNAKRPFYFAEAFLKEGWSVDVVTSYAGMTTLQEELTSHTQLNIKRIKDPIDSLCQNPNSPIKMLIWRFLRAILWPDELVIWSFKALFKTQFKDYDRIILCLRPASFLFTFIKKISDRWILDYSEVFYPVHAEIRRSPVSRLLSPLFIKLQQHALKKCLWSFFTSKKAQQEYVQRKIVDQKKTTYLPLFFDEKAYLNIPPPKNKFIIAYFGLFGYQNNIRSPEPFFKALNLFLSKNQEARSKTTFIFFGRCENYQAVMQLVKEYELQDVVEMNPPVPYKKYLELLQTATALLLLVSNKHNLFVPSKMLDYFGAQRPILGFVPPDSEVSSMLKDANMNEYISSEKDAECCAKNIETLWNKWKEGLPLCENSKTKQWTTSFQTSRILDIIKQK